MMDVQPFGPSERAGPYLRTCGAFTMLQPPPPTSARHYPVTAGLAVLAILVTAAVHLDRDVSLLFLTADWWPRQPWRLVTTILPHLGILHLLFNVYWLWAFGTLVENRFGTAKTAGLYLLLAVGSSAAEFAFASTGVGLSGVVYGLFGLLWMLDRRDVRFQGAVDSHTTYFFVGWFFACILLSVGDWLAIANVAHGAGAILGGLVGLALKGKRMHRPLAKAALAVVLATVGVLASVAWPHANFYGGSAADDPAWASARAYSQEDDAEAIQSLRRIVRDEPRNAEAWFYLGHRLMRTERWEDAADALGRAVALNPHEQSYTQSLVLAKMHQAYAHWQAEQYDRALRLYQEVTVLDEEDAAAWHGMATTYKRLGRTKEAADAQAKADALRAEADEEFEQPHTQPHKQL